MVVYVGVNTRQTLVLWAILILYLGLSWGCSNFEINTSSRVVPRVAYFIDKWNIKFA